MVVTLKIFHILVAAAWFGHKLLIPRDMRDSIRHIGEGTELFIGRIKRAERLGQVAGLLTVASGLGLIYLVWGFADAPVRIYLGLGAALAMFVIGAALARPAWNRIEAGLTEGDATTAAASEPQLRRALLLENLLWVLALGAMVT
ncbi:MAG: hypothetical protein WBZ40_01680 [Acidimicrobiia bacterium]